MHNKTIIRYTNHRVSHEPHSKMGNYDTQLKNKFIVLPCNIFFRGKRGLKICDAIMDNKPIIICDTSPHTEQN